MDSDDEMLFHLMMQEEANAAADEEDRLKILVCLKALQAKLNVSKPRSGSIHGLSCFLRTFQPFHFQLLYELYHFYLELICVFKNRYAIELFHLDRNMKKNR
jgi:hypothetical protein